MQVSVTVYEGKCLSGNLFFWGFLTMIYTGIYTGIYYLAAPFIFSIDRNPPIPSMPVMTTHIRSMLRVGGAGQPLMPAHQDSMGCRMVA